MDAKQNETRHVAGRGFCSGYPPDTGNEVARAPFGRGNPLAITVVDHPLSRHYLSILRDRTTDPAEFRRAARRLSYILTLEATSKLPETEYGLETPLAPATGYRPERPLVAVAVLRAGLGLIDAVVHLVPDVAIGYAGVQRDEETAQPMAYYTKFPQLRERTVLVLEPMLATGGSLGWAVERVKEAGATHVVALCVVAAPEGAARMEREHPDVEVVTAAIDSRLNDDFFIVPGLGDMGDRLFDTPP